MAKRNFNNDASNPFEQVDDEPVMSLAEADKVLFGEIPDDVRIIATPMDIDKLTADRTQPRRAIPLSIRQDWDGNAAAVMDLLMQWKLAAEKELSQTVNAGKIIRNETLDDVPEPDPKTQPIADKYMALVQLATGIKREGLLNPIQIDRLGQGGLIVAGERRWLAHHLLKQYDGEKWGQIPCVDVEPNPWKQAQENGNRSPLNAIEMARQLALLFMDMYRGDDGVQFDPYEALVSPGGSDRPYYAQVANGRVYHIKHGFSEKMLEATGLKSRAQISQYRNLLNLDDETWMEADENNWTEYYCRTNFLQQEKEEEDEQVLTAVNTLGENEGEIPKNERAGSEIRVGEVRTVFEDQHYPYLIVQSEANASGFHKCLIVNENRQYIDWKLADVIRETYQYRREEASQAIPMDDGGDVADHPQADLRNWRETVKGVEVPLGNKIPDYPHDEDAPDLTGDESPNRPSVYGSAPPLADGLDDDEWETPEPIYQRMRYGDGDDRVAHIVQYKLLQRLLNNLDLMAGNMNLNEPKRKLKKVNLLSPGTVAEMVEHGGVEAVDSEFADIEEAFKEIFHAFIDEWEEFKGDILSEAQRLAED